MLADMFDVTKLADPEEVDEFLVPTAVCTTTPGLLMPGPNVCTVVHELAQVPAVVRPLANSQKPIIRTASAATPVVAYSVPPLLEDPPIVVLVCNELSQEAHGKIVVELLHVATASSGEPPLCSSKTQIRKGTPFEVPSVAPDGTVMD